MDNEVFRGFGVQVQLVNKDSIKITGNVKKDYRDAFLKVRETLTRIGIASKKDKVLYQSCHLLFKQGCYSILHFKELFGLDNRPHTFSEEDRLRRNKVVSLLEEWGLVKVLEPDKIQDKASFANLKILRYEEKGEWTLKQKYAIGKKKSHFNKE